MLLEGIKGQRAAEEEALKCMTADTAEKSALLFGFNALGDYREAQRTSQRNYGLSDGAAADIGQNVADEGTVDLQLVKGQSLEVGQRGISGAEIIQGKFQAMRL